MQMNRPKDLGEKAGATQEPLVYKAAQLYAIGSSAAGAGSSVQHKIEVPYCTFSAL